MDSGGDPPLSLPPDLDACKIFIATCVKRKGRPSHKFVNKIDIPSVELPAERTCHTDLNLVECGIIGQFTGLWPSPKAIDGWVQRNWRPLVFYGIRNHFLGRGYYVFIFYSAEDRDLILKNGPYFMGP